MYMRLLRARVDKLQDLRLPWGLSRPKAQDTLLPAHPHTGCEAVVKANHDDLIPLAHDWFRVSIWPICSQWCARHWCISWKALFTLKKRHRERGSPSFGVRMWYLEVTTMCNHEKMLVSGEHAEWKDGRNLGLWWHCYPVDLTNRGAALPLDSEIIDS